MPPALNGRCPRLAFLVDRQPLPGEEVLEFQAATFTWAMRQYVAAVPHAEGRDRIFVHLGLIVASVDLTDDPRVIDHKTFGARLRVKNAVFAIWGRCGRVEQVAVSDPTWNCFSIWQIARSACEPIDQIVSIPDQRAHKPGGEACFFAFRYLCL
jgi:hypothetical protein